MESLSLRGSSYSNGVRAVVLGTTGQLVRSKILTMKKDVMAIKETLSW